MCAAAFRLAALNERCNSMEVAYAGLTLLLCTVEPKNDVSLQVLPLRNCWLVRSRAGVHAASRKTWRISTAAVCQAPAWQHRQEGHPCQKLGLALGTWSIGA